MHDASIFTKIVNRTIQANIIEETQYSIVITDINPQDKYHWLIITKKPYRDYRDFMVHGKKIEIDDLFHLVNKYANQVENSRIMTNNGDFQEIKHLHIHVLGH